ncbi:MAG: hypothetical protein ACK55Z_23675, partial [bacterium]
MQVLHRIVALLTQQVYHRSKLKLLIDGILFERRSLDVSGECLLGLLCESHISLLELAGALSQTSLHLLQVHLS